MLCPERSEGKALSRENRSPKKKFDLVEVVWKNSSCMLALKTSLIKKSLILIAIYMQFLFRVYIILNGGFFEGMQHLQ